MRKSHVLWLAVPLIVGLVTANLIAQAQTGTANAVPSPPRFEYATLIAEEVSTGQADQENPPTTFNLTWNAGLLDVVGTSNSSINDARRRLNSRLGGGNDSRTNLSTLLTTIGNDGWQLIESTQNGSGLTRVFIRRQR